MSQQRAPRVKLPEVTPPKLSQPSSNSWAANQAQTCNKTPTAAHRNKYENKPMPPTPEASPSPAEKPLTARRNRGYIQPAIPLKSPSPANAGMKNRAVTDPVAPKHFFTSTNNPVHQLRKKYSHSRNNHKSKENEENVTHRPTSPPAVITHKASQILGVYPVKDNNCEKPPASAPPSTHTPDPFRTSTESKSGRHVSPNRQVQSTPVPTRRYLQENNMPALAGARSSQESKEAQDIVTVEKERSLPEDNDGSLNPARLGTCGRKGDVEYVNQNEMQRVPSFAGIIEHPESPKEAESRTEPDGLRIDWNGNTLRPQYSKEILQPMAYTPSNYAGVWENDPNVVSGDISAILEVKPLMTGQGPYTTTIQSFSSAATFRS